MALSKSTLAAIQKTGTVAHNLKLALKSETKKYSDRLSKALSSKTDSKVLELLEGADIAQWKGVGKLSQMIDAIEADLVSAFKFASELMTGESKMAKKALKAKKAKANAPAAKKASTKTRAKSAGQDGLSNADKLLAQLKSVLSTDAYAPLKQTQLAKAAGIPLGSISAAIKKLVANGDIVQGKDGGFKLSKKVGVPATDAAPQTAPASVKAPKKVAAKKTVAKTAMTKAEPVAKVAAKKRAVKKAAATAVAQVTAEQAAPAAVVETPAATGSAAA